MRLSDYKQSAHSWSPGGISFIEICLRQIFTNGSWLVARGPLAGGSPTRPYDNRLLLRIQPKLQGSIGDRPAPVITPLIYLLQNSKMKY